MTTSMVDKGLIVAILRWWEEHKNDVETRVEEYQVYATPPDFVVIALALKAREETR